MFYCKFFVSHHMLFQIHMLRFIHMISISEIVRLQMAPILEKKIVYFSIILFHFQKRNDKKPLTTCEETTRIGIDFRSKVNQPVFLHLLKHSFDKCFQKSPNYIESLEQKIHKKYMAEIPSMTFTTKGICRI